MSKKLVLLIAAWVCGAPLARGQQPPAKPAVVVTDSLALDLLATNPSTPADILRVLNVLIDLGQAKAGQSLLQKLVAANLDDDQLADLDRQFGSGQFLKLSLAADLQPLGKQLADRVLAAANKQARDPAHIARLVERLKSASITERAAAIAELERGGDAAIGALLKKLSNAANAEDRRATSDALTALGAAAVDALAVAVEGDRAKLAALAAGILGNIEAPEARQWLLGPALGDRSPGSVRAAAQQALIAKSGALPDRVEAAAELYRAALEYDQQPPRLPEGPGGLVTLWSWDSSSQLPAPAQVPERLATRELAARLAAAGRDIFPDEPELRRLQNVLLLEAAIARAGGLAALDRKPGSALERVAREGVTAVEDLLEFCMARQHPGPAAVAAEILGRRGSVELLAGEGGKPRALVRATAHGDRRLRFAAVAAVIELDPQEPYPGSSLVADALKFFIGSHGMRTAVVGDIPAAAAQEIAGLLAPFGYQVKIATSSRELVRHAIATSDLELVLVDMVLANELSGKVVQDLRHDCRTAHVPVGILASTRELARAGVLARRETRTAAMLRPLDLSGAQAAVAALQQMSAGQPPAEQRLAESREALGWLASRSLASRVELYPLVHFESELVAALQAPALIDAAIPLLAELGTPACQLALVELASAAGANPPARQAAAAAFGKNVTRHGILLSRAQIVRQYDRYNATEGQDRQAQMVLATILDDLEAYAARQAARDTVR